MDSWINLNILINQIVLSKIRVTLFSLLAVLFSSQITIAELVVKPTDTEALVDQPTYFNCSTSVVLQDVQWFHFPLGPNGERNFVYGYDQFYNQYKDRFMIEKNAASGTFNLIIESVQVQDAGRYECQDDVGRGAKASARLIVLDKSPTCHSNQKTNEVIGPNECGIAPEELHLTCSATYHGDDAPVLNWFKDGSDQPLADGVSFSSSGNQSLSNLTLKPDSIKDDSTFHCQTTRSKPKPFGCTSGSFAIVGTSAPTCPSTSPCVAAIVVTWLVLIPIIVAASVIGGMYLQTRRPLKIFTRPEKGNDIEVYQTPEIKVPRNSDVVESTQPFIVPENTAKTIEEQAKQYEELTKTTMLKLAQLEKKIKHLEKEKHDLEERLYPQAIASYSKKLRLVSTIEIKDIKPDSTKDTKPIFGMMILHNKLFVVTEKSSDIEVYDSITFNPEPRWPIPQMSNPLDMAGCSRNNCLYICDSKTKNEIIILRIDASQSSHTVLNKWSIGEEAGHLSVSRDANVVVSLYTGNKINEYSPEGKLIREVWLSPAANISHPWHAVKTTSMHFIFSHGTGGDLLQRVCVARNTDGKVLKSFGGKKGSDTEKEQMSRPVHILEDSSHNLLVADMKNNKVLLLSSTLEYKGILLSKDSKLRFPMRLCLDEEKGILFVADNDYTEGKQMYDSGRILIFNYKIENS